MRLSYRPELPPQPHSYRTQVLDHLGLVAGMFEELGIAEVIDQATQQDPAMRIVTVGHAVKAMVLNGLGFVNQQLYLVPHFFQNKPLSRLIAPAIEASHLNDDTLGRALDTLYAYGVTERYRLIAATAATRELAAAEQVLAARMRGLRQAGSHPRMTAAEAAAVPVGAPVVGSISSGFG